MNQELSIDFNWLPRESGDIVERLTLADVKISVGGFCGTELEDLSAKTVRKGTRVSVYSMATWFVANWWRLRWESNGDNFSWQMSHKLGAAGDGYLWPDLTFSCDGKMVTVHSQPSLGVTGQVIRYLNSFDAIVSADIFERRIDEFIESVIGRLSGEGLAANDLAKLWAEVCQERHDPVLSRWRKFEAIAGFDPGEGPDPLIESLIQLAQNYGQSAVEEIAAESKENTVADIEALWNEPYKSSSQVTIPEAETLIRDIRETIPPLTFPWQKAEVAARLAREKWSLGNGPIETKTLGELLSISPRVIEKPSRVNGPIDAGYRNGDIDRISIFLRNRSKFSANRRFSLMRIVGDHLTSPEDDRLLPSTHMSTYRQKFQRAFAQEFLCPYNELIDHLGSGAPTDEDIEDSAYHFDVSPLMVKTILVNKGHIERSSLAV